MPQVSTVRIKGPVLQDLCEQRGMTPPQLARKIGRHRQSVTRLMRKGGPTASRVFAYQLANALGVEIADFTFPDDPAEAEPDEVAA
jgi:transcriptional regulator with XRE-family HTH domain